MGRMIFDNWCKYKGEKMGVKFTEWFLGMIFTLIGILS